jgi:hypothetical protein
MHRVGWLLGAVLVVAAAMGMPSASAVARIADQAAPDLEDAIRLYALPRGFVFRGECAAVSTTATAGLCYEATIRGDGDAEVWLTDLASGDNAVVLFAEGNPGWYPFTPGLVVSGGPGVNTLAQWADVAGTWTTNGALSGSGYPGLGYASMQSDGSGAIGAGRFDVARVQLSAVQDGIAVGSLTVVRDNFGPNGNSITSVTDVRSAPCALVVLNDGSIVLTSVIYGASWFFTRLP